ncbi:hypothetical protein [Bradyrhizobium retamae]|uniref:Uncharacterized protein n=1 Tax=Bradyrhizobium retamae TaxID=1300035 RepID=A0A0R3MRQ2_9BRAD|nr:hypothetical protein [Bradyrhizobium retamae]KRR22270.1 hypothetical protein CQ13_29715 [Bradyrhizobium retamae]
MRQKIETAPRDGNAHWSPEAGQWIGEAGEPSKITPSHRYPMPAKNYLRQGNGPPSGLSDASTSSGRARCHGFFSFFSIAAILVAPPLIGLYFHAEVIAYVARYASQQTILGPPVMAQQIPLPKDDEAAQFKRAVDSATADLRQSLQQEHDWAKALETELVNRRRDVDMLLGEVETLLSEHKINEVERLKQAVDSATADLRQSLQQEHDRAEALATELAKARRATEQKPAAAEEKSGVSLLSRANSDAVVKPGQTAVQPDVATETSKPAIKPSGPVRVEHESRGGYGCQHFRTLALSRLPTNDWLTCWLFGPTIGMPSRRPQQTRRPTILRKDVGVRPNQKTSANLGMRPL